MPNASTRRDLEEIMPRKESRGIGHEIRERHDLDPGSALCVDTGTYPSRLGMKYEALQTQLRGPAGPEIIAYMASTMSPMQAG